MNPVTTFRPQERNRYVKDVLQVSATPVWLPFEIVMAVLEFRNSNPSAWMEDDRTKYLQLRFDSRTGNGQFSATTEHEPIVFYTVTAAFRNQVRVENHESVQSLILDPDFPIDKQNVALARVQELIQTVLDSKVSVTLMTTFHDLGADEHDMEELRLLTQTGFEFDINQDDWSGVLTVGQLVALILRSGVDPNRRKR